MGRGIERVLTLAGSVPAGMNSSCHDATSYAGRPAAEIPGVSGTNGERSRLVTAKARKRLDWTRLSTVGGVANGHLNVGGDRLLHGLDPELVGEVLDIIRLLARDGMTS